MHRLEQKQGGIVELEFEGDPIAAQKGDSVAAALLASDHRVFRTTPVSGASRGPLCLMGVCFDCLVEIDGVGNRQACMIEVQDGMKIKRQQGAVDLAKNVFDPEDGEAKA